MLRWRLLLGPIIIAALIGVLVLDALCGRAAPLLGLLCALLSVRSVWEMCQLLRTRSFRLEFGWLTALSLLVLAANWFYEVFPPDGPPVDGLQRLGPVFLAYALAVIVLLSKGALRYETPGTSMENLGGEILTLSYVGMLASFTAQLRWVQPNVGYLAFVSMIVATKSGDIGAYTFGRLFGRRKMIPKLSPGKTWMGAVGALVCAGALSVPWFQVGTKHFATDRHAGFWVWSLLFGVIIGATGILGDLCESLIKRDVGQKDSSALIPGFGGLLDVLDSILFAAPVAYLLWLILPLVQM